MTCTRNVTRTIRVFTHQVSMRALRDRCPDLVRRFRTVVSKQSRSSIMSNGTEQAIASAADQQTRNRIAFWITFGGMIAVTILGAFVICLQQKTTEVMLQSSCSVLSCRCSAPGLGRFLPSISPRQTSSQPQRTPRTFSVLPRGYDLLPSNP